MSKDSATWIFNSREGGLALLLPRDRRLSSYTKHEISFIWRLSDPAATAVSSKPHRFTTPASCCTVLSEMLQKARLKSFMQMDESPGTKYSPWLNMYHGQFISYRLGGGREGQINPGSYKGWVQFPIPSLWLNGLTCLDLATLSYHRKPSGVAFSLTSRRRATRNVAWLDFWDMDWLF